MSCLVQPVCSQRSPSMGTRSSMQLGEPTNSRMVRWVNPTTATSLTVASQVVLVGVEVRVRLSGRFEVADVLQGEGALLFRLPDRFDPHAHPDIADVRSEDQVQEGDVGAVEKDVGRYIGGLDL